jgi:hypothetical protein
VQGTTLVTSGDCIQKSVVYLPKGHAKSPLNVIVWLHGLWVDDFSRQIFGPDETDDSKKKLRSWNKLRESVDRSGRDVVIVAPFLGHGTLDAAGNFHGTYSLGNLAKANGGLQPYLDQILGLVGDHESTPGLSSKDVDKLVIACHSGGGNKMRQLTEGLGPVLGPKLCECWGFDCVYVSGHTYGCWADALPGALKTGTYFYFYSAAGTSNAWGHFRDFWKFAYGTPSNPEKQRMNNVFLSVALQTPVLEALSDAEVFQSYEAIDLKRQQGTALTDYEKFRLDLDPTLDGFDPNTKRRLPKGWDELVGSRVKGHYQSVQDLFKPRIDGLFSTSKPAAGANVLAQLRSGTCSAAPAAAKKPAPPHKQGKKI